MAKEEWLFRRREEALQSETLQREKMDMRERERDGKRGRTRIVSERVLLFLFNLFYFF